MKKEGYYPTIVDRIEDIETILLMIAVQMGISILPSYVTLPVSNDRRIVAIPYEPDVQVNYAAISMKENQNPALEIRTKFLSNFGNLLNKYKQRLQRINRSSISISGEDNL